MKTKKLARVPTGIRNLDAVLGGGLPKGSVTVLSGPPGAGKTTIALQLAFSNASSKCRALCFSTLSEPTAKTLRYMTQFRFFDRAKLEAGDIELVDLGLILRTEGLADVMTLVLAHLRRLRPKIVLIDSFKVFDDLAATSEERRKFSYELAVKLMAWETTTLLLGEYSDEESCKNPLFSIVDGLITTSHRESSGEQQRFVRVAKMRGTDHSRDEHTFVITSNGVEVFAPRVTLERDVQSATATARCMTGISHLDALLGAGIPRGSSLLISGVAGTGKTVLGLEFVYRGALAGEKGVVFSFEETPERLRAAARSFGWDLDGQIARGALKIVFIPQPRILVERHLLMMEEVIEEMGAQRVLLDSVSVFLHKVRDPQIAREKTFQLASIIHNANAVGFFATDIPYGSGQVSRFGVEETVVDGLILLTSTEEGLERQRFLEVYKLRNTAHLGGRHSLTIASKGIVVYPRYRDEIGPDTPPAALDTGKRLATGIPGLDKLLGGGLLARTVTLVSGSPGIGKTTMATQFVLEAAREGERALFVSTEEGPNQLIASATALGLPLAKAVESGLVDIMYLSLGRVQAAQFLSVLTERIQTHRATRVVLDSVGHILKNGRPHEDLRDLLNSLAVRFKSLGVTSLFTLESMAIYSSDTVTDHGVSLIADNLIMLRYARSESKLCPLLTVVKTRGTAHEAASHRMTCGPGGLSVDLDS